VRREAEDAAPAIAEAVSRAAEMSRPRAVVAAGPDSRLLRAVLETVCPVPFVAWPGASLPGWAGSLDLVVVLAPEGSDHGTASAVAEAVRRGCQVVVAGPPASLVGEHAVGRYAAILPVHSGDQLVCAVVVLSYLDQIGLGPATDATGVAQALDDVAIACGPSRDLAVNPAKMGAIALADVTPLVWGGSVLSARAARRVAESLRRASGQPVLSGDAEQLLPVIEAARPRDLFDDPFAEGGAERRPLLLVLDDGAEEELAREQRTRLVEAADARGVRVEVMASEAGSDVARYASLVLSGTYTADYLRLGLVEG